MGRFYVVTFENTTITAATDLVTLPGVANKILAIHKCWWGLCTTTLPSEEGYRTLLKRLSATVTLGSGGTGATGSITPSKLSSADAACSLTTARTKDSTAGGGTRTSTGGTTTNILAMGNHVYAGFETDLGGKVLVASGEAFIMGIESTPAGTTALSGGVILEEIG